ncbi:hypothetical protein [Metabacillus malikii]|nr:hypothetical protein [Metabacillus malikii]
MHHSHGIGYAEYARKHEKRMDVERARENDYRKSQSLYAKITKQTKK